MDDRTDEQPQVLAPPIPMRVVSGPADDAENDPIGDALEHTAWAIGGLKERLAEASSALEDARFMQLSEEEIGRIFLRAQAFADEALAEALERARAIVSRAEVEAARILDAARRAAAELSDAPGGAAPPSRQ